MERVRIPSSLNDEDVFLAVGPIKMSMRQLCVAGAGVFMWFGGAKYFIMPIFGFTMLPAMLALLWLPALFLTLAFVKVQQRPIDQWLGDKFSFMFGTRTYILREHGANKHGVEADLYHDDDIEAMLDSMDRPQAFH